MPEQSKPRWTVVYNIVSPESAQYVGTGWEFFVEEKEAMRCYERHNKAGNVPTKRPYHDGVDREHLGAAHRYWLDKQDVAQKR